MSRCSSLYHALELVNLHRDLLRLRREDAVLCDGAERPFDGAILSSHAFLLRWWGKDGDESTPGSDTSHADDRLVIVNLGVDLRLNPAPEPLLAPPDGATWQILWSSEDPRYGGQGTAPLDTDDNWLIPGYSTVVLRPIRS